MRALAWSVAVLAACGGAATGEEGPPAQIYVHYDTITLTKGGENATTDTSSAIGATLTGYLDGDLARQPRLDAVTQGIQAILAPFYIEVVTARPDLTRYDMIVIAGTRQQAGLASGDGAAAVDCLNQVPNKVVVIFGNGLPSTFDGDRLASLAVAGLGFSQGLPSSNLADDCLCWSGPSCNFTEQCTFGGPGTPVAPGDACAGGATTMDPMTEFTSVFGLAH